MSRQDKKIKRRFVLTGRAMDQADNRRPSPRIAGFDHRPVHVRLTVDEAVLGQVFLPVLRFSRTIPPLLHALSFIHHCRAVNLTTESV